MIIKADLGAMRRTRWHEYLTRFVLGGLITALTGWLAHRYGPVLGGLFLAFPAIFPASATLLDKHEREKKRQAGIARTSRGRLAAALDARGAVMGAVGGMVFALLVWKGLPHDSLSTILPLALIAWLAVSSLLWSLRRHHPWRRRGGSRPL